MPGSHSLTIEPVFRRYRGDFGPVEIVYGYRGKCSCGKASMVYGTRDIPRQWHGWHQTPISAGKTWTRELKQQHG